MTQFGTTPRGYAVAQKPLNPLGLTWAEMARAEGHRPGQPKNDWANHSLSTAEVLASVIDAIRREPGMTRRYYADKLNVKPQCISNHVMRARELGFGFVIEKTGGALRVGSQSTYRMTYDQQGEQVS